MDYQHLFNQADLQRIPFAICFENNKVYPRRSVLGIPDDTVTSGSNTTVYKGLHKLTINRKYTKFHITLPVNVVCPNLSDFELLKGYTNELYYCY